MTQYQVGIDEQVIWTGYATTGVSAIHEALQANPDYETSEDMWVETL